MRLTRCEMLRNRAAYSAFQTLELRKGGESDSWTENQSLCPDRPPPPSSSCRLVQRGSTHTSPNFLFSRVLWVMIIALLFFFNTSPSPDDHNTYTRAHAHTRTNTHTHTHSHARTHARTHKHTYTHAYVCAHTRTQTDA